MINKKNIIILSSDAFSLINFRSTLIQKLASDGCIVHCMAPGLVGQFEEKVQQLGAKTLNISMSRNSLNPFLFIYELIQLYLIIKKINCDILISYFLKPNIIGGFLNRLRVAKRFIALVERKR